VAYIAGGSELVTLARTNHADHFAEHGAKATNVPEKLAKDLLDAPAARVTHVSRASDDCRRREAIGLRRAPACLDELSRQAEPLAHPVWSFGEIATARRVHDHA